MTKLNWRGQPTPDHHSKCPPGCACGKHKPREASNPDGIGLKDWSGVYGPDHPRWKDSNVQSGTVLARGHRIARRLYPLDGVICEWCKKRPATEHHHIDGNTDNNKRKNVALLCSRCHQGHHRKKTAKKKPVKA